MRIAVTGGNGQLGRALAAILSSKHQVIPLSHQECDVATSTAISQLAGLHVELIIHAAALTDVDGCTQNPDLAYAVNALGTRNVALACQGSGALLLYLSTNEVFDGIKEEPYLEFDEPNPCNVYGRSKLAGERFVQSLLDRYYIVRTAWLYGKGRDNFVTKILALAQREKELRVVSDEIGSPTYAQDLAEAIGRLIETGLYGIYHFSNEGACSRYEFAAEILRLGGRQGPPMRPIALAEYQRPSRPPQRSALRNFCGAQVGITLRPWREALADFLLPLP